MTNLEAELADGNAVEAGLLRGSRRRQFDVVDAKVVEGCVGARSAGADAGVGASRDDVPLALEAGGQRVTAASGERPLTS